MSSEMRVLLKQAERQGWRVSPTRSGHIKFVPPDPSIPALVTGSTPSDRRSLRNLQADLRRRGLTLSPIA